jgi:hypothetical protein
MVVSARVARPDRFSLSDRVESVRLTDPSNGRVAWTALDLGTAIMSEVETTGHVVSAAAEQGLCLLASADGEISVEAGGTAVTARGRRAPPPAGLANVHGKGASRSALVRPRYRDRGRRALVRPARHRDRAQLDTTPRALMTEVRLDRARPRLLAPGPEATASDRALASGFAHVGRFAEDYRRRCGERRSQTLRSAAGLPG